MGTPTCVFSNCKHTIKLEEYNWVGFYPLGAMLVLEMNVSTTCNSKRELGGLSLNLNGKTDRNSQHQ